MEKATGRTEAGLSLVELVVALALMTAVMTVATAALVAPYRAWIAGRTFADEQQNARLALEWMSRRLRMAGVGVPAGTSQFFIEAAESAVSFLADVDRDGVAETRRFCLDSAAGLVREQLGSAATSSCTTGAPITAAGVARPLKVIKLEFAYFDGLEQPLTPVPLSSDLRPMVARVRITLALDSNRSGFFEPGTDLAFTMNASLRNY